MQNVVVTDGGPFYAETDLTQFISEPWNAVSSLAIMLPSIYWAIKLRKNVRSYAFLYFLMPLLFLGGLGSTLYHAFRSSRFLLWMDVYPTAIVTLAVSIYFWNKALAKKWQVVAVIVPSLFLRILVYNYMEGQFAINLSYFITGFLIFFPVIFYLRRHRFRQVQPILISVIFLCVSLVFRRIDISMTSLFPMGSHFLWHIFSGVGAFYLAEYLYRIRQDELKTEDK